MAGTLLVVVFAFAHLLTVALTYPGRIVSLRNEKIVGGSPAALGQYPYQVPRLLSSLIHSFPSQLLEKTTVLLLLSVTNDPAFVCFLNNNLK